LDAETVELILHENAERVYKLDAKREHKDTSSE